MRWRERDDFCWENAFAVVDREINAAGIHVWPFDPSFPIDVRFFIAGGPNNTRMNRHRYCEVLYVYQGQTDLRIHDRSFRISRGDLVVIGGGLYHSTVGRDPIKLIALYFEPELVRGGTDSEEIEFLRPFFYRADEFPHMVPRASGIPQQVIEFFIGFARSCRPSLPGRDCV
jgi:mannose-6-phosphate isomerase-like protein (cupin superfamily)